MIFRNHACVSKNICKAFFPRKETSASTPAEMKERSEERAEAGGCGARRWTPAFTSAELEPPLRAPSAPALALELPLLSPSPRFVAGSGPERRHLLRLLLRLRLRLLLSWLRLLLLARSRREKLGERRFLQSRGPPSSPSAAAAVGTPAPAASPSSSSAAAAAPLLSRHQRLRLVPVAPLERVRERRLPSRAEHERALVLVIDVAHGARGWERHGPELAPREPERPEPVAGHQHTPVRRSAVDVPPSSPTFALLLLLLLRRRRRRLSASHPRSRSAVCLVSSRRLEDRARVRAALERDEHLRLARVERLPLPERELSVAQALHRPLELLRELVERRGRVPVRLTHVGVAHAEDVRELLLDVRLLRLRERL
mmetsp:Transcript_26338/g.86432  ORF Transcript_26338/g.86432 Transcript_26338/m.86432 type:complete len:370 (-) Transcript_26338:600-1709(-)